MDLSEEFLGNAQAIHEHAMRSLFELFEDTCEGALAVDREARIAWIDDKYRTLLGLDASADVIGLPVEDVIPNSLMREVVQTGQPILLDVMQFKQQFLVVTRIPLKNAAGEITGAVGFVLYDRLQYLKPLMSKFSQLQSELANANRELAEHRRAKYTFSHFIGNSAACLQVKREGRRAAQLDTTVMLLGETGTGKELLAHAIHAASRRAGQPFVGVNVAAIPEQLMEAEFFGVAPGAYTGAERKGRDGKFKLADGGTLFLDEVGDMPMAVQAKLLRALQEQEIEPLGSNRVIKVDARVIAATSRDLKGMVEAGKFRPDLYYRLNVLPLTLPPLRQRLEDLEALCDSILEQIGMRTGARAPVLTPEALAVLSAYAWPGNVRELRNVLERAAMLSDKPRLAAAELRAVLPAVADTPRLPSAIGPLRRLGEAVHDVERATIRAALVATRGKKAPAAKLLGISRATLYDKLVQLQLLSEFPT